MKEPQAIPTRKARSSNAQSAKLRRAKREKSHRKARSFSPIFVWIKERDNEVRTRTSRTRERRGGAATRSQAKSGENEPTTGFEPVTY
jgi:hypothetical protein